MMFTKHPLVNVQQQNHAIYTMCMVYTQANILTSRDYRETIKTA